MQIEMYKKAVAELAVPKLTDFLKAQSQIVIIEGWSGMKAPEKRDALTKALADSKELRKEFVVFYSDLTGEEGDFSEWETADLPDVPGLDTEVEENLPEPSTAPVPEVGGVAIPEYVEGAFETIVADVAGLNAEDSNSALMAIEDKLGFEHIRMGVLLGHIHKSEHYVALGYENMRAYLAANTDLHYRKAMILVANAQKVQELGINAKELKGVSWSALRHILPVMDATNYKHWLDMARSNTHVALIEEVREEKAKQAGALPAPTKDGAEKPKLMSKLFNLYPDQKSTVDAAIEKAKIAANVESTGAALDVIAAAYTGAPATDSTVGAVMPDLSDTGLLKSFSKIYADEGDDGLVRVLKVIGELRPDVTINVQFPKEEDAA